MTNALDQLQQLGLTIYVTCQGYDASLDAPFIRTGLPEDYDGDAHAHLLTSSCEPTRITGLEINRGAATVPITLARGVTNEALQ